MSKLRETLIYRLDLSDRAPELATLTDFRFDFLAINFRVLARVGLLYKRFGASGAAKALLKLATGHRYLCCCFSGDRLVSYVWSTSGAWQYPVESGACVLGPLRTEPDVRRQGLATAVLRHALAHLWRRGYRLFYIDTATTNFASQRAIAKAGFGEPFARLCAGELIPLARDEPVKD